MKFMLEYKVPGSEIIKGKEIFAVDVVTAVKTLKQQVRLMRSKDVALITMYWISTNGTLVRISNRGTDGGIEAQT